MGNINTSSNTSSLNQIKKGKEIKPPRIILYGVHGLGKSSFPLGYEGSLSMPSPIYLPVEDGLGSIDCEHFPVAKVFDSVLEYLQDLYTENHSYKTLVLDSLDWLEKLIFQHVAACESVSDIAAIPFGRGYKLAEVQWGRFIERLELLRNEKKMIIFLIAHAQVEKFNPPELEPYDRYQLDLHKKAFSLMSEWADIVLFANYKVYTATQDLGFGQKSFKAKGSGDRVMFASERPTHNAKNRYNLPDEMGFSWAELWGHLKPAMTSSVANGKGNLSEIKEAKEAKKNKEEK